MQNGRSAPVRSSSSARGRRATPIKVERNDDYWGDEPHLDGIEFHALIDQTSRTASLEAGDVDLIFTQDPTAVHDFRAKDGFVQVEDFAAEETFAMLNVGDAAVRQHPRPPSARLRHRSRGHHRPIGGGHQTPADSPFT